MKAVSKNCVQTGVRACALPSEENRLFFRLEMTIKFSELKVGDHFLWPVDGLASQDSVNVNIKIAWSEDGGGFATDLLTRKDCESPFGTPLSSDPCQYWIHGDTSVLKLNGSF